MTFRVSNRNKYNEEVKIFLQEKLDNSRSRNMNDINMKYITSKSYQSLNVCYLVCIQSSFALVSQYTYN